MMSRYVDTYKPVKFRLPNGEIQELCLDKINNIVELPYVETVSQESFDSVMSEKNKLQEILEGKQAFVFSGRPFYLVYEGQSVLCRITGIKQHVEYNQQLTISIDAVIIGRD